MTERNGANGTIDGTNGKPDVANGIPPLLPCPFCGALATYVWDDVNGTWTAGCTNHNCIACANTTMMYGWPRDGSTIEEAGEMWNRRVLRDDVWNG